MGGLLGGGTHTYATKIAAMRVQTSAYGQPVPLLYGKTRIQGNLIWYSDFTSIAHTTSTGGGKGGGGSTQTDYTYTAAVALALCEGQVSDIGYVWADKDRIAAGVAAAGMSIFSGALGQSPWGFLSTNHASEAIGYSGVAYVAAPAYDLGSSASLPQHTFEAQGNLAYNPGTINDADPKAVVTDLLTADLYGAGFPTAKIGDLTAMSRFCVANGIFIAPFLNEQTQASELITRLCKIAYCAPFFSEGVLKVVPYSDATATGNGVTFTPDLAVQYDLTDDDYAETGDDPVVCVRKAASDCYNQVQVKYYDRAADYNEAVAEAKDQAAIELYGLRTASVEDLHEIVDAATARLVAQQLLQRMCYVRNTYKFNLGLRFMLLEPMDIVTLTDSVLGLNKTPVRITSIEEDGTDQFAIEAEEFQMGAHTSARFPSQGAGGYLPEFNADPGDTNSPFIFDAAGALTNTGYELWIGASGGVNWGGCQIWVSTDDLTYQMVGSIRGAARMGYLTAAFAAGADPDTSHVLSVDLSGSSGELDGGTVADADNGNTLALLENELIAYSTATLTGTNRYNLTGYIRRGLRNSAISAHPIGARFLRLDQAVARYAYEAERRGQTVYLKFPAFNKYGGAQQSLADVSSYSYTIGGSISYPNAVTGFSASQNGNVVIFQWDLPTDTHIVAGFDIRYNPKGDTVWEHGTPLTQVTRGTQITSARVAPGSWTFMLCAHDIGGNNSVTPATFDLDVINDAAVVATVDGTLGTLSNFVRHWTGALIPVGTKTCNQYGWEVFDKFVPDPAQICTCQSADMDGVIDGKLRVHGEIISAFAPGETGVANPLLQMNYRTSGGSWLTDWQDWTIGTVNARYVRERIYLDTTACVPFIKSWMPTIDATSITQTGSSVVIAAGGTAITFSQPFHNKPGVSAIVLALSGLIATVDPATITNTGFTAHVYNVSGTDVGGTINWTASGV